MLEESGEVVEEERKRRVGVVSASGNGWPRQCLVVGEKVNGGEREKKKEEKRKGKRERWSAAVRSRRN